MNLSEIAKIVASAIYVLFIPGFLISFVLFKPDKIDWIERLALSFALSLAIVPLMTFYSNLLGIKITSSSVIIEILIVLALTGIILPFRYFTLYKKHPVKFSYVKFAPLVHSPKTTESGTLLNFHSIMRELFQISLITYLILLLAEAVKTGFVSFFFNLNILLSVVIVSGIGMVITHYEKKEAIHFDWNWKNVLHFAKQGKKQQVKSRLGKWDRYYILMLSIGGGLLVYYKTQDLEGIAIIVSVITMIIIFLLSYLLFTETD